VNETAKPGHVFICLACGKRSRDRWGERKIDRGWDESCMMHSHEVTEADASKARIENGLAP